MNSEDTRNDTHTHASTRSTHVALISIQHVYTFREYSLLTWQYAVAFLKRSSVSSPAGEGTQRDSVAFFYSPAEFSIAAALLSFSQPLVALPPNLQKCFCGSIAEELTLQKCLTKLLMASS